jgi:hypothetical protein
MRGNLRKDFKSDNSQRKLQRKWLRMVLGPSSQAEEASLLRLRLRRIGVTGNETEVRTKRIR